MPSAFERFWSGLTYAYIIRVPLLIFLLLTALPFAALREASGLSPLLKGLFDIADPNLSYAFFSFALVTLASFMAAAAIAICTRLILWDAHERFGIDAVPRTRGINLALRIVPAILVVSIVGGAAIQSAPVVGMLNAVGGILLGVAAFFLVMTTVHRWLWDQIYPPHPTRPAARKEESPAAGGKLGNAGDMVKGAIVGVALFLVEGFAFVARRTPYGFIGPGHRFLARHIFALLQFYFSLLLYGILFYFKAYSGFGSIPRVPTLCLVIVLSILACWALSGISFLLDRYRVPVLSLMLAYGSVVSVFPQSDHYYQSIPRPKSSQARQIRAATVLARRSGKPAIVVAATGGGIQAAAWTARVIEGLHQDGIGCNDDFDASIVAISAVSGGSVGAMYVLDSYKNGQLARPQIGQPMPSIDLVESVRAAEASSLDEVTWGLTYPDLVWTFLPFLKGFSIAPFYFVNGPNLVSDRGAALENAWKRTSGLRRPTATLDRWREDLARGDRPAAIFNATIAETGERMIFSTTVLDKSAPGRREFVKEYDDVDVEVTTAARLSATFPYVSPASRVLRHGIFQDELHVVDGGYYDNYGTATLIEWLNAGLRAGGAERPSKVLLLQIRSAPTGTRQEPDGRRGWSFDLIQPIATLYSVRGAGQLSHSDLDVELVQDEVYGEPAVPVLPRVVEFPRSVNADGVEEAPPLSWHLTPKDLGKLKDAWKAKINERRTVHDFLGATNVNACIQ